MELSSIFYSPVFAYLILPVLIFLARVIDVSLGTMRVIFVSRGYKPFAALCGFFEVLIWLIAMAQIIKNLTNVTYYIAYAGGFATGNYVGMLIEEKIALGRVLIRVVISKDYVDLMECLKSRNYGVTVLDAKGLYGNVKILFTVIPRHQIEQVVSLIKEFNPHAFYTIEDIRFMNEENIFHKSSAILHKNPRFFRRTLRKGK